MKFLARISTFFKYLITLGEVTRENKVLTKGLCELKDGGQISGYRFDIEADIKNDQDEHKKTINIYIGSKTKTFEGYSNVALLAEIRLALIEHNEKTK